MRNKNRITRDEMEGAIFQQKAEPKQSVLPDNVIVYTMIGSEDMLDKQDNPVLLNGGLTSADQRAEAYAKKVVIKSSISYFVKLDDDRQILDPEPQFASNRGKSSHAVNQGKDMFVEVSQAAFLHYLGYLRTKNRARLVKARREMM